MPQHEHAGEHHGHGVDFILSGVLRRAAVRRLEKRYPFADVSAGRHAQSAHQPRAQVGDDVPVEIGRDNDIVFLRAPHQLHAEVIDERVMELDVRVSLAATSRATAKEQAVREFHDVGFMRGGDLFAPVFPCVLESVGHDAPRAGLGNHFNA